jgi:hypothetical protein
LQKLTQKAVASVLQLVLDLLRTSINNVGSRLTILSQSINR